MSVMAWEHLVSSGSRIVELGFPLGPGMPEIPRVPAFTVETLDAHDDFFLADGSSGTNEVVTVGSHAGTHLDALNHVSVDGRLHGGLRTSLQTPHGIHELDTTTVAPLIGPGRLVDLPALLGRPLIEEDLEVDAATIERAVGSELAGSVVLLRTGWGRLWREDPDRYATPGLRRPGFAGDAVRWLGERGVVAIGSDAYSIETTRPADGEQHMRAHVAALVEHGIFVLEQLDLDELAGAVSGGARFLFIALPLRWYGATGSPIRPIAIL
jgi:kynurenine formamidase